MVDNGFYFIGEIVEGIVLKAAGVGGKHRGRQNTAFGAGGGNNGQGDGERAFADTGYIVNGQYPFLFVHQIIS